MDNAKKIGDRIKEERIRLGINQTKAAEVVGVRREMWGRYERGSVPGDLVADKLHKAGFDVDYIFTGIRSQAYEQSSQTTGLISDAERIAGMYAMLSESSQRVLIDTARRLRELELLLKTELDKNEKT